MGVAWTERDSPHTPIIPYLGAQCKRNLPFFLTFKGGIFGEKSAPRALLSSRERFLV